MRAIIKQIYFALIPIVMMTGCASNGKLSWQKLDFKGKFSDDYSIHYIISDSLFIQEPGIKYHILKWDVSHKYIIARNDIQNPSEPGLYTRIDYMEFKNMQPYTWGFCFTQFKAASAADAEQAAAADRSNPMKGCGGFPFSRMKREG